MEQTLQRKSAKTLEARLNESAEVSLRAGRQVPLSRARETRMPDREEPHTGPNAGREVVACIIRGSLASSLEESSLCMCACVGAYVPALNISIGAHFQHAWVYLLYGGFFTG